MTKTGRPRRFDRDEAIGRAMLLFWEQGYEGTSLAQLKAAMGDISSASFYNAFASKEALFEAALARYLETHGRVTASLHDPALEPREAVEQALRLSARMQTDDAHPSGCLLVLSACSCSSDNSHVQVRVAAERDRNRQGIEACVARAVDAGALAEGIDVRALAGAFDTFLVGISTQARDGVPFAALDGAVSQMMRLWDMPTATRLDRPSPRGT